MTSLTQVPTVSDTSWVHARSTQESGRYVRMRQGGKGCRVMRRDGIGLKVIQGDGLQCSISMVALESQNRWNCRLQQ